MILTKMSEDGKTNVQKWAGCSGTTSLIHSGTVTMVIVDAVINVLLLDEWQLIPTWEHLDPWTSIQKVYS